MRMHVVAVGRVRRAGLRETCDEYARRAGRYFRVTVHEVAEAGRRAPTPAASQRLEAERLRAHIPADARVVACTRDGRTLSSRDFARTIDDWREQGRDIALVVGGAFGLAPDLVTGSDLRLALAPFTLPHDIARLVLLEQLYRAGTILRGEPYHKGAS